MKNKIKLFAITALAVIIGFGVTGCGDPPPPTDKALVISGTLTNTGLPSPSVKARSIETELGTTQRFSGTVQKDYSIEGLLEDGAMRFKLTGIYDPQSKSFSMQAASSFMVFSLTGLLNNKNAIDPAFSKATVQLKQDGEWIAITLNITPSAQKVNGKANQPEGAKTPEWARGVWYDQLVGNTIVITQNSILIGYGADLTPLTIVEMKDVDSNTMELIARVSGEDGKGGFIDYTLRFYITNQFDVNIQGIIPDGLKFTDFNGMPTYDGEPTINDFIQTQAAANKKIIFVAPYCSNDPSKVDLSDEWSVTEDGYSPLFNGSTPTSDSKNVSNVIKAVLGYSMILMDRDYTGYTPPPPGELVINFDSIHDGKWVTAYDSLFDSDFFNSLFLYAPNSDLYGEHSSANVQISNGKAIFDVYKYSYAGYYGYSGNDEANFIVYLGSLEDSELGTATVVFENGKGSGEYIPPPTLEFINIPNEIYTKLISNNTLQTIYEVHSITASIFQPGTSVTDVKNSSNSVNWGTPVLSDGKIILKFMSTFLPGAYGNYDLYISVFVQDESDFIRYWYSISDLEVKGGITQIDWQVEVNDLTPQMVYKPTLEFINVPSEYLTLINTHFVNVYVCENDFEFAPSTLPDIPYEVTVASNNGTVKKIINNGKLTTPLANEIYEGRGTYDVCVIFYVQYTSSYINTAGYFHFDNVPFTDNTIQLNWDTVEDLTWYKPTKIIINNVPNEIVSYEYISGGYTIGPNFFVVDAEKVGSVGYNGERLSFSSITKENGTISANVAEEYPNTENPTLRYNPGIFDIEFSVYVEYQSALSTYLEGATGWTYWCWRDVYVTTKTVILDWSEVEYLGDNKNRLLK